MAGPFSIGSDVWPGVSKLVEEMGELNQVLGKLIATAGAEKHWDGSNLRQRFIEEAGDVLGALRFAVGENLTEGEQDRVHLRARDKHRRFAEWHLEQIGARP